MVNEPYTGGTCDFTVRRRTEKGWTLDFVFSGNTTGTTFYFLGLEDDLIDTNYADNNPNTLILYITAMGADFLSREIEDIKEL